MATNEISTGYTSYSISTTNPLPYEDWLEERKAEAARCAEERRIEEEAELVELRTAFPEWADRLRSVDQLICTIARLRLGEGDNSPWEGEYVDLDQEISDYDYPTSRRGAPYGVVGYSADYLYVWVVTREETEYRAFPRHLSAEPSPTTP